MKALILTGENQYHVVSHFIDGIMADLALMNIAADNLSMASESEILLGVKQLAPLIDYQFVISFNGVGLRQFHRDYNIVEFSQHSPCFVLCVDHPIYILKRLLHVPRATLLCVDKEHVSFARQCGFSAVYFPHAVSYALAENYKQVPPNRKSNTYLFPVSYLDLDTSKARLAPVWNELGYIIEQCKSITPFMQAIGLMATHDTPANRQLDENLFRVCILVDQYLRAREREICLRYFQFQDKKLTVIGNGVNRYEKRFGLHDYLDPADFSTLFQRIAAAQYVVHHTPGFESGLHERVIYPLMLGTPVLTVDTPFINQVFPDFTRNVTEKESIPVSTVTPDQQTQMREQILNSNTWYHQLTELLSMATGLHKKTP